jgi:hypothetical protein
MQSTKVRQPRLLCVRISVSITKVGFAGTFLATRSQCVDRSHWLSRVTHCTRRMTRKIVHYMHRIPMSFGWQKGLFGISCVCKKRLWVHVPFRVVLGRLRWLSSCCNIISVTALFYKASDLCRLATATSFIVTMFKLYVQNDFRYTREFTYVLWSYYHVYPHTWLLLLIRVNSVMFVGKHMWLWIRGK